MARKREKKPKPAPDARQGRNGYREPDDMVSIDRVDISLRGRDCGPVHLWLNDRDIAEELVMDKLRRHAIEEKSNRAHRVDNVERLFRSEKIDQRMFDACRKFQADFYIGQFNGYPKPKYEWVPASTIQDKTSDRAMLARDKIHKCVTKMGGPSAAKTIAAFRLIGECLSLNKLHCSRWQRMKWEDLMMLAIEDISSIYEPMKKRC